jgi:hypothetical protein
MQCRQADLDRVKSRCGRVYAELRAMDMHRWGCPSRCPPAAGSKVRTPVAAPEGSLGCPLL